tara:strand:- start:454 stop:1191 length:738 start_codon:yes stop_codon:yes gene_type:complete
MPHLADYGRCIAIDLIGMGDSEKLDNSGPDRYTLVEHREYWRSALEALRIDEDIILVIHDWGSALGFDFAAEFPHKVAGICYMEGIIRTMTWDEWPDSATKMFKTFRSSAGEEVVLEKNVFVERVLPASIMRKLSDDEMSAYIRPFKNPGEDRRPTLTWPRQIPLENEPKEVCDIVERYSQAMASSDMPKLFINAEPGMILSGVVRDFARTWKNQTEVTVKGLHFIQEDSPKEISSALKDWLRQL